MNSNAPDAIYVACVQFVDFIGGKPIQEMISVHAPSPEVAAEMVMACLPPRNHMEIIKIEEAFFV